jgi:glucosamine--fructose-6-phosphate aminotransferase (isomerizing)
MCGIYGLVLSKNENIYELIINGLIQLQNRGYDSSGLSLLNKNNTFEVIKYASTDIMNSLDKLHLTTISKKEEDYSLIGMGHNRWATHGVKDDINAHPHLSNNKNFVIVHNGIIENYSKLKTELIQNGYVFISQTDTEVIVNLIEYNYTIYNDTFQAISKTIKVLEGTYGLIIQSINDKNKLYCVRNGSPLLIGQNEDKVIVTSEQSGFCNMIKNYITLHNDDICVIEKNENNTIVINTSNTYLKNKVSSIVTELTPHPFNHWTLKEINEQSNTVLNAINKGGRIKNHSEVKLGGLEQNINILKDITNIIILGCGSSYFAGLYGMYYLKNLCNFNTVQVFDGADFDQFDIPILGNTGIILISQSGETKDLHRCISIAKNNSIATIGIINVVDSLIAREVDCGIYCNAGKEVGVASTKAFTSQVVCLNLISIWFAQIHNLNEKKRITMIRDLHNLSNDIKNTIELCDIETKKIAEKMKYSNMFLIGKGSDEYIAKEGSLKIKEISYIHSEGYSSSSLKHGPFALLDEHFPVIIINLDQMHKTKTLNCYQEVSSRKSPIIFITNDITITNDVDCEILFVPENKTFASLLGIIPIQLLAYYLSINRGINPDKPKNLAKVVTVE